MSNKEFTTFPEIERETSPLELYNLVYPNILNPREEIFYSHPITSSGVRDLIFSNDEISPEDKVTATIVGNSSLARLLVANTNSKVDLLKTLPANLGARNGWGEFDYNRFWFYFITGIDPQSAAQFEKFSTYSSGDRSVFNDYHADRASRKVLYETYVQDYINFVKFTNTSINPVREIVFLPDADESLGCMMEKRLAHAFGIPTSSIYVDGPDEYPDRLNLLGYALSHGIVPESKIHISKEERAEFDAIYEEVLFDLARE